MELKEFIKATIQAIVEAANELQSEFEGEGVIVNPPVASSERDYFEEGSPDHILRRIELIEFDVAVTATSESKGSAKAGIKVFSLEAGADGSHARINEQVSRVQFKIPLALAPSPAEDRGREAKRKQTEELSRAAASFRPRAGI